MLRVDAQALVVGDVHVLGRVPPGRRLLGGDAELLAGLVGELGRDVGGGGEVGLRHQVRVDVVVLDRAVLVRAGDALDAELAVRVVLAEGAPQPGGLDQQRQGDLALERLVVGRLEVVDDGGGDVGVDVEGGGARGPVAGALLAVDGPPGERRARQAELGGVRAGDVEGQEPPAQRVRGRVRVGVGQHRQHERLGVPEGVPVVAGPGQSLGRDRPLLGPGAGLQDVEQPEADGLLDLHVAVDLDVGALPEVVEELALLRQQPVPAGQLGGGQGARHLGDQRGPRPLAGPAVAEVLDQPQFLARAAPRRRR